MTQPELAAKAQVAQGTIGNIETGARKRPRNLLSIAAALGVEPGWLETGKEPMHTALRAAAAPPGTPVPHSSFRKIWAIGRGSGGAMPERIWGDDGHLADVSDLYSEEGSSDADAFLAEVRGNSMYPKFENKNFALVEPNTPVDIEDCVLVRLKDGQTLLKRLLSRRNGIVLGSYNEPQILNYEESDVTWMYYVAHEVPRKKIKTRF